MEQKMIAVRLEAEQAQKLDQLVEITGWNQSEIIRRLIDVASVRPAALTARIAVPKEEPLVANLAPA